jgi:hypothetical protein
VEKTDGTERRFISKTDHSLNYLDTAATTGGQSADHGTPRSRMPPAQDLTFAWRDGTPIVEDLPDADGDEDDYT